jgi:hypothetical protein
VFRAFGIEEGEKMSKDEALRLALEAMESFQNGTNGLYEGEFEEEITAIKAALEAKDEPVIDESAAKRIATALGWEPKRTWVGLTDEELAEFSNMKLGNYDLCLEVEAKLKEKNCADH